MDKVKNCLVKKFIEGIAGEFELVQFEAAVRLYLEKLNSNNTEISAGKKIIMKVIGPWEEFESKVLTFLRKNGLRKISKVIHSNRGKDGIMLSDNELWRTGRSIGGQGFLTIMTKAPIPPQLEYSLYIVTHEWNIQTERQRKQVSHHTEGWLRQIEDQIEDYNKCVKKGHNLKDSAHFSKYFPKFKAEIASQREWNRKIKLDTFFPNQESKPKQSKDLPEETMTIPDELEYLSENEFRKNYPRIIEEMNTHQKYVLLSIARLLNNNEQSFVTTPEIRAEYERVCKEANVRSRRPTQVWAILKDLSRLGLTQTEVKIRYHNGRSLGRIATIRIRDIPIKEILGSFQYLLFND